MLFGLFPVGFRGVAGVGNSKSSTSRSPASLDCRGARELEDAEQSKFRGKLRSLESFVDRRCYLVTDLANIFHDHVARSR